LFIVFEGPDGSGKTMQMARLARHLRDLGENVVETREPGGTPLGNEIRSLLLNHHGVAISGFAELFLLAAARTQNVTDVIDPAIAAGSIVLCDRFVDSTYAYQGGGRGIPMPILETVQDIATGGRMPDISVLLDVPVEIGLQRRFAGTDEVNRLDLADLDFHQRVRQAYLDRAGQSDSSWIVVDAVPSVESVAQDVQLRVMERIHLLRDSDLANRGNSGQ
jgi:dTMP kinase